MDSSISDELRRFVLRSIDTVPHLEAILVFHRNQDTEWDAKSMSKELYISDKKAHDILESLASSGFVTSRILEGVSLYRFNPKSLQLEKLIEELERVYVKNLIEITNLIHSKISKQAQEFGDAFKWQQDQQ